jgi:hypothetical protein
MDHLQKLMETNRHLITPQYCLEHISTITKFWSALTEEDQDYIHGAQYAIEKQIEWKVNGNEE